MSPLFRFHSGSEQALERASTEPPQSPLRVTRGRTLAAPFHASVDVVIVGSGSGGAVVARTLARAGLSVLILEEGGYYTPDEYGAMPPTQALRRLAREAGLGITVGLGDTPVIAAMSGKCVGGSSVLTGGVSFRIPEAVLHEWATDLGLARMAPDHLAPHFEAVEALAHVETVPEGMRSRSTELFLNGAERLGIGMKPLRRNTQGCRGASRCNFGCPHGAKQSVDVAFLPDACAHGAHVVADALVERIDVSGGVATGVRGRLADGATGEPHVPFTVRAKLVVVACGALHSPLLLAQSGVGGPHVGRHLTLHPAFRVGAIFDENVEGWDGALQSVYSDHFADDGITLVGVYSAANVLAAAFPGIGPEHRRLARRMPNLAVFGGMVHDDGGGRVRRFVGREPLVTYRMSTRDKGRLLRGMSILGRMAFAAGAREVLLPIFGLPSMKSAEELAFLTERPPPGRTIECMAFHPLGSVKMSATARDGVVQPTGETWNVRNLFVVDGSILPTSIGVNSQLPIMAVAHMLSERLASDWPYYARRAG